MKTVEPDSPRQASDRVRVKQREVLSNGWARVESVNFDYLRSSGEWQNQTREVYHRGHGATILLYNLQSAAIVLTRQFRFPAWSLGGDGFLLEAPAGIIEGDDPAATIQAETQQETGFFIEHPEFLFKAFATPGSVTEQLHYYAAAYDGALRSGHGGGLEEEGEDIEVIELPIEEAIAGVKNGQIIDAKTIILIQYAQLHIFADLNLA